MNSAIIVAAGSGTRFGTKTPKQFLEILGKPLIIHTLERFESCSAVDEIILVLSAEEITNFRQTAEKYNLKKLSKIISGGETRAASVFNGLNAIDSKKTETVAVHDGARPLVSTREISATIEKAKKTGAACLVAAVNDTIKEVADGKIVGTIDRLNLRRALTPQCFRYEILKRAFAEYEISEIVTDECFLVEKLGYEIATVDGSTRNIKITRQEDFVFAENLLKQFKDSEFRI
ncbi:MAG TPA: 2-C-methyl-D-erythritol 4-phosphate cytidylyltransferase [Pyrinomonadaceae bacterium]|nr:2-C-methyl-D-erythritol 4-phosphate cytidylyltransferase [Pyrinomonadaceae bacterium]